MCSLIRSNSNIQERPHIIYASLHEVSHIQHGVCVRVCVCARVCQLPTRKKKPLIKMATKSVPSRINKPKAHVSESVFSFGTTAVYFLCFI